MKHAKFTQVFIREQKALIEKALTEPVDTKPGLDFLVAAKENYPAALNEIEQSHELSAAMADAIWSRGGGDVYFEAFGRLCFCSGCMILDKGPRDTKLHASSCDDLWLAWKRYTHNQLKA